MEYSKLVAITGMPGIYEIINTRQDGMIVKSLATSKSQFVSSRIHGFSVLETISMYTDDLEGIMLIDVFRSLKKMDEAGTEIISAKSGKEELMSFFGTVVPNYDRDQVYPSDVKKVIKWYNLLKPLDVIHEADKEADKETENGEDSSKDAVTTD